MKAIVYEQYGPAEVLQLREVEKPSPAPNEVLIRVHAASINSLDWRRMRATPFLVRTNDGLLRPKDTRMGADVAGVVEAVGSEVRRFVPGDAVFGEVYAGSYAEYVCAPEDRIARIPAGVPFEAAAATPIAGLTALQGLRDFGKVQPGEHVLINGASGGVGTFAVQIAKAYAAEVTAVCSTRNQEMARRIGADHVIDYTREDFIQTSRRYDVIFDVAANRSVFQYRSILKPGGRYVLAGFTTLPHLLHVPLLGGLAGRKHKQKLGMMGTARTNSEDLEILGEMLSSRAIVPPIDDCYPLEETASALRQFEEVHARGKIVIMVRRGG